MTTLGIGRVLATFAIFLIFLASQLFWFRRIAELGERLISSEKARRALAGTGAIVYIYCLTYGVLSIQRGGTPTRLTWQSALVEGPAQWWLLSSLLGFAIAGLFGIVDHAGALVTWGYRKVRRAQPPLAAPQTADPPSTSRRRFLAQTARTLSVAPFIAGGYGLLYGRLNLHTTNQRIKLARLPRAFHGFRIAQLSDIHIGPFMSADQIRKYVAITNELRADLIALTGDFISWDGRTQEAVVEALSGVKAPYGAFGCLGNHEAWSATEDSITQLFAGRGIRILRGEHTLIQSGGDALNLIGVDFQSLRRMGPPAARAVQAYLLGVERLVRPDTANILLSHNPNTFDRAAELGIDLSLAGHTHGGQVTLEFIHPSLSPGRLITDYVSGWFQKGPSQLYVNRGIGTIGFPIRLGAPPEITVFELVRES